LANLFSTAKADFQVEVINSLTLLTSKPITYLVNLSTEAFAKRKSKWLKKIHDWVQVNNPGDPIIPFSVSLEETLVSMSDEDKALEGEKLGLPKGNPSALGKITKAGYSSLHLIRYFTCE
jgi:obg-like ATPase 1